MATTPTTAPVTQTEAKPLALTLTSDQQNLITSAAASLAQVSAQRAFTSAGGGVSLILPTDTQTPAIQGYAKNTAMLAPLAKQINAIAPPKAPSLPTQLGPFNWNPISFPGFDESGWMQLTLYSNGNYNFVGGFHDGSAWDYDDQLVVAVKSHSGVVYTFSHSGSMTGWLDWFGSSHDNWSNTGNNGNIKAGWADLCASWRWQGNASINWDFSGLWKEIQAIIGAAEKVIEVVGTLV